MNWDNSYDNNYDNNFRILSQPLRLFWNGWESDTLTLQRSGWEVSVSENIERNVMAIALRHKETNMRGFSDFMDFDFYKSRVKSKYDIYQNSQDEYSSMPIIRCRIASDFIINIRNTSIYDFHAIDARPVYNSGRMEGHYLDELAHFKRVDYDSKEIFLEKASMKDILDMALEKQRPQQELIRKKMIRQKEMDIMRDSKLKAHLRLVS